MEPKTVIPNPWQALRQFTPARIALGRSGVSLPTSAQLDFQLAHAGARDAVHRALDVAALQENLAQVSALGTSCIALHSAADSRDIYLQRPDLGRRLDAASCKVLTALAGHDEVDLAIVIADGLSALAIERHAAPLLHSLMQRLAPETWSLAPTMIVHQGRVAIGDEVGQLLSAKMVLVLIGERPGLSSPDSMGLYLTWAPRVGLTDQRRNCISNVRPAGLSYDEAAYKLHYLMSQARGRQLTGVELKDETLDLKDTLENAQAAPARRFLL
jgi:ethanolamine ammonia-lyase small subunit